jgi:hypothetical protein
MFDSLIDPRGLEELCQAARSAPPGAIVEVGVYKGGSAARLYDVAQSQGRRLYLYDTFSGHPYTDAVDDHKLGRFGDAVSPEALRAALPDAQVIQGLFPDCLVYMEPIAFVHADADLYRSTLAICTVLPPLMVKHGVLWFDDYSHSDTKGCRRAVDECFPSTVKALRGGQAMVTLP